MYCLLSSIFHTLENSLIFLENTTISTTFDSIQIQSTLLFLNLCISTKFSLSKICVILYNKEVKIKNTLIFLSRILEHGRMQVKTEKVCVMTFLRFTEHPKLSTILGEYFVHSLPERNPCQANIKVVKFKKLRTPTVFCIFI